MRNFKTIIALLLSLVMIFSLVACGSAEDEKEDKKDKEKTEQTDSDKDTDKGDKNDKDDNDDKDTDKDNGDDEGKKPGKEESKNEDVDDYSVAQLIVGKWEAKLDVTELIAGTFIDSIEDGDEYFEFDDMYYYIEMSFTKDGDVKVVASMDEAVEIFIEGIEKGFPGYAESLGTTMEEIYEEMDTDEDGFAEAFAELMGVGEMTFEEEGVYEIDGNEIVVDGDGLPVEFKDVNTFVVSGEDFEMGLGEDAEFERSGKFNPPAASEVEDNEVSSKDEDDAPSKDEDDEPSKNDDPEDLIVGKWSAKVDASEFAEDAFFSATNDLYISDYFDFDGLCIDVDFEFKKNGEVTFAIDFNDFAEGLIEILEDGIEDYADETGFDVDDFYAAFESDEEDFVKDFADNSNVEAEAEYEIDGNEIVIEGEGCEFEFDGEDTLLLNTVGLGLEGLVDDDMIEFERQ